MRYRYQSGDVIYDVLIERQDNGYRAEIDGQRYQLEVLEAQPGALSLRFDSPDQASRLQMVYWVAEGETIWLSARGCTYRLEPPRARRNRHGAGQAPGDSLRAPMPAQVRAVKVTEGDAVETGQTLLILEAMKMEIRLVSPRAGRVARLLARTGETVAREQVLVELSAEPAGVGE